MQELRHDLDAHLVVGSVLDGAREVGPRRCLLLGSSLRSSSAALSSLWRSSPASALPPPSGAPSPSPAPAPLPPWRRIGHLRPRLKSSPMAAALRPAGDNLIASKYYVESKPVATAGGSQRRRARGGRQWGAAGEEGGVKREKH
jgi:hypothetical protein